MGDFENVKEQASLKEYAAQYLTKSGGGLYCCPACGSGTHGGRDSDGALGIYANGTKWKCQSCQAGGDIFDLAGILNDTTDQSEQLKIVAAWANVPIEGRREAQAAAPTKRATEKPVEPRKEKKGTDIPKNGYTVGRERHRRYIAECAERLKTAYTLDFPMDDTELAVTRYIEKRGITPDEAMALGIGYDPNYKGSGKPRIILPWAGCDYYHIDRALEDIGGKYHKPSSAEVDKQPIYNPEAFTKPYVIVVEGVLDAIAIDLCGYNAVAIGGDGAGQFANEAAARSYSGVVIDMLDADGDPNETNPGKAKGRGAGAELSRLMAEAGITCLARAEYGIGETDDYGGHKDAGAWFADNRADLAEMLEVMRGFALEKARNIEEAQYREAMRSFNIKDPANVARDVLELRDIHEPIPTGIKSLDEALGGGVSLGETTFFGAVSSYGKTTLAVQIADHMASKGYPVLFVTIEQSAKEIIAKSLSRLVYTENLTGWNIATPQEITSLQKRKEWSKERNAVLSKAVEDYDRLIAPNMRILEGTRQPNVNDIRTIAAIMKEHDPEGRAPIIFIDYLQLLAPISERYDTDKRNADMNVSELRKMARDLTTHVWCISSLNRSSYSGVISLDSFKESGGIEYGADNLLGLQPLDMAGQLDGVADSKLKREADKIIKTNKAKTERDCELTVLKQRNGALPGEPIPITFKPMAAYFIEPSAGGGYVTSSN